MTTHCGYGRPSPGGHRVLARQLPLAFIACLLVNVAAAATAPPPICRPALPPTDQAGKNRYECDHQCAFEAPVDVQAESLTEFEKYEGRVPYMYLDTRSNVTTGIGDMLPNSGSAAALPFFYHAGTTAEKPVIEDGYGTVAGNPQPANCAQDMSACHGSSYYSSETDLILKDVDIDTIAEGQIAVFGEELKVIYPDFDSYPSNVQLALYDMIFNLGQTKLQKSFPSFDAAIAARDWQKAADESHRSGISEERNDYVKNLLEQAASDGQTDIARLQQCPAASTKPSGT
jgi:GH24 family phage-related lysozyme (muramidase)